MTQGECHPISDYWLQPFHFILNTFLSELLLRKSHYFSRYELKVESKKQLAEAEVVPSSEEEANNNPYPWCKIILGSINCTYDIHIFKKYFEWDNSISDGVWGNQFNSYLHFVRNSLKTRKKTWMNSFEMLNKLFIRI